MQHALEGMVDLGAPTQALGKARGAHRHDHELLEVDVIVGMHAAVEDVHHRCGQQMSVDAAQVLAQRQASRLGSGAGNGQRHAQDGVGAELGLVGGTIRSDQRGIDGALIEGIEAHDGIGALVVDVLDGLRKRPCPGSGPCRHRAARRPQRRRSKHPKAPLRGQSCRPRARPRPRRWDCRGCRAPRDRRRPKYRSCCLPLTWKRSGCKRPADRAPSVRLRKLAMSHFLHYALS